MAIRVTISGNQAIASAIQAKIDQKRDQINEAIQGAGIDTEAMAKQSCPVDTGRLRASIKYTPGILSCTVGTNVNYGPYVEFGTRRMAARAFLYPAFYKAVADFKAEMSKL